MASLTMTTIAHLSALLLAASQAVLAAPPPSSAPAALSSLEILPAQYVDPANHCPWTPSAAAQLSNENTTYDGSVTARVWPRAACSLTQQLRNGNKHAMYQARVDNPTTSNRNNKDPYWISFAAHVIGDGSSSASSQQAPITSDDLRLAYTATLLRTCNSLADASASHWFMSTNAGMWSRPSTSQKVCAGPNACATPRDLGLEFEFTRGTEQKDMPPCVGWSKDGGSCVLGQPTDLGGWSPKINAYTCNV